MIEPFVMRAGEGRFLRVNFGNQPELETETLTGTPTVTVSPAGPTISSISISGTKVVFFCTGVVNGTDYTLTVTVQTSGGSTLVENPPLLGRLQ